MRETPHWLRINVIPCKTPRETCEGFSSALDKDSLNLRYGTVQSFGRFKSNPTKYNITTAIGKTMGLEFVLWVATYALKTVLKRLIYASLSSKSFDSFKALNRQTGTGCRLSEHGRSTVGSTIFFLSLNSSEKNWEKSDEALGKRTCKRLEKYVWVQIFRT